MRQRERVLIFFILFSGVILLTPSFVDAATRVGGIALEDQHWIVAGSPYIIRRGFPTANSASFGMGGGATLTIDPGVVVKFEQGTQLGSGSGIIKAVGTPENPIIFTALTDDTAGGDTNGDGDLTQPVVDYWNRIVLGNNSDEIQHVQIRYGRRCILLIVGISIKNNLIENCSTGIDVSPLVSASVVIEGNTLKNNGVGIDIIPAEAGISFSSNNFVGNTTLGARNKNSAFTVDGRNNWWGSASGPFHPTLNPSGNGDGVSDDILFNPWLNQELAPQRIDPVIIIPGILGSFQKNGEWVIDPVLHTYDNLIETLIVNGYTEGEDLFTFPYEWRDSNTQTALLLRDKINDVQSICGCDKVDLVAHSMGGLIARQYVQFGHYEDDVDQLIFLGTPHLGAPKAYLTWEAGAFPSTREDFIMKFLLSKEAKKAGHLRLFEYVRGRPMLSVQELLSINNYLKEKDSGILRNYPDDYPRNIFLEFLNNNIFALLEKNITITNVVGDNGFNNTVNILRVVNSPNPPLWERGYPEGFDNIFFGDKGLERGVGDGTVPLLSANFISDDSSILLAEHKELVTEAERLVVEKLTDISSPTLVDEFRVPDAILIFSMLSPADFQIIAPDGKIIGKNLETGGEFNEIEGAFYSGFLTDDEFITIPDPLDGEYQIITQGTDDGSYTVAAGYITDEELVEREITAETQTGLITGLNLTLNSSEPEALEIEVADETSPEALIFFDPELRDIVLEGIDDLSETVDVDVNGEWVTLTDESGNITELYFQEGIDSGTGDLETSLSKIVYNGDEADVRPNSIKYGWIYNKQGRLNYLRQFIKVERSGKLNVRYWGVDDVTQVIEKRLGEGGEKEFIQGLKILRIKTNNGEIEYEI